MSQGLLYALGAYILWGLLPLFWKLLQAVSPVEVVAHRIIWSFAFSLALLAWRRRPLGWLRALHDRRTFLVHLATGLIMAVNWLTYVYAVNSGYIVEASLGYFISPLFHVLAGVVFMRESLRPAQWAAIGLAAAGVLYLTLQYGAFPWIALTLAAYFSLYGLLKKRAPLAELEGQAAETAFALLPALGYLVWLAGRGQGALGHADAATTGLLPLTGVVTAGPLMLFTAAARRTTLSSVGILQYLLPTLQFLIGVLVYGEPFGPDRVIGFCLIWTALILFSGDSMRARRRAATVAG